MGLLPEPHAGLVRSRRPAAHRDTRPWETGRHWRSAGINQPPPEPPTGRGVLEQAAVLTWSHMQLPIPGSAHVLGSTCAYSPPPLPRVRVLAQQPGELFRVAATQDMPRM